MSESRRDSGTNLPQHRGAPRPTKMHRPQSSAWAVRGSYRWNGFGPESRRDSPLGARRHRQRAAPVVHEILRRHHDKRWLQCGRETIYNWHYRNERYLRNEAPFGALWRWFYSQQTAHFLRRRAARGKKVEDHTLGYYQALVEARIALSRWSTTACSTRRHVGQFKVLIFPNIAALSETAVPAGARVRAARRRCGGDPRNVPL